MKTKLAKAVSGYKTFCRKAYVSLTTGAAQNANAFMLFLGAGVLAVGLSDSSFAQTAITSTGDLGEAPGLGVGEGDGRIFEVSSRLFELIEGNFGSLIMIAAGLGAIISAAFGAYRAAVGMLVVAVGAFILRSLVAIFFNYE